MEIRQPYRWNCKIQDNHGNVIDRTVITYWRPDHCEDAGRYSTHAAVADAARIEAQRELKRDFQTISCQLV